MKQFHLIYCVKVKCKGDCQTPLVIKTALTPSPYKHRNNPRTVQPPPYDKMYIERDEPRALVK